MNDEVKKTEKTDGAPASKSMGRRIANVTRACFKYIWAHPLLQSLFIAICLFSVVDMLHYRSAFGSFVHFFSYPHFFLLNVLIVWGTLMPALFLRRRYAYYMTVCILWFGFGIANCVMLTPGIRTTPLEANDLEMLFTDPLSIVGMVLQTEYLSLFMVILIAALILLAIAVIIFLWFKLPTVARAPWQGLCSVAATALVLTLVIVSFRATGVLPSRFKNLKDAYSTYGFSYCLPCTFLDRGIDKPEQYEKDGEKKINTIKDSYGHLTTDEAPDAPNIIFLQLESFFNVNDLASYAFNEDPTPFFNSLKESYPHGYLSVPSIAAGTANTEFEIITGMSLDFFGAAEYPYKTILQKTVCESAAFVLKDLGYEASAIHNHTGTFYDRHEVYERLGFDRFVSREFMTSSNDKNLTGWVRDAVLTEEILKALTATEGRDYIYTVSVQGHGGYPSNGDYDDFGIRATAIDSQRDEAEIMQYNYYVNQMRDMDNFLRDLTEALLAYEEKTVLVMYGDHLPGLDIQESDFKRDRAGLYETEYVVWSNYSLQDAPTERKNVHSYQLSAYVFELLGIHEGNVFRYHQTNSHSYAPLEGYDKYNDGLWMLQYDILYGKRYVYGEDGGYSATDMKFGYPTVIREIASQVRGFTLYGEGFTPDTKISLNGEEIESVVYVSEGQLVVALEDDVRVKKGDKIVAYYQGQNADILTRVQYTVP